MAYPRKLLAEGEEVVAELHPHAKDLVLPTIGLLVLLPGGVYVASIAPEGPGQAPARIAVAILVLGLLLYMTVVPYARWLSTLYVLTDRRVISRRGIVARSGRDLPLSRINDVAFEHSGLLSRMLGCGTLTVESAGERGQIVLRDVPDVEVVQREIYRLAEADEERRRRGGDSDDGDLGW